MIFNYNFINFNIKIIKKEFVKELIKIQNFFKPSIFQKKRSISYFEVYIIH